MNNLASQVSRWRAFVFNWTEDCLLCSAQLLLMMMVRRVTIIIMTMMMIWSYCGGDGLCSGFLHPIQQPEE